jgi:hypothetical protein
VPGEERRGERVRGEGEREERGKRKRRGERREDRRALTNGTAAYDDVECCFVETTFKYC